MSAIKSEQHPHYIVSTIQVGLSFYTFGLLARHVYIYIRTHVYIYTQVHAEGIFKKKEAQCLKLGR